MSDERFDLSALDLEKDPERFERMVGNVMWRAQKELKRRRGSPIEALAALVRPAMTAAALIAGISVATLAIKNSANDEPAQPVVAGAYMSGAEVPVALTSWYEEGSSPTADELLVANGGQ